MTEDHPRGCGEHELNILYHYLDTGSSPRMRGALLHRFDAVPGQRIIPADAGSTVSGRRGFFLPRDHPRGCGEHA